jgi:DNA (cytosine-5)-methyltransferase 1
MTRPRLLDVFAGAQGATVGYARAGFTVTAVDIELHDRHPEVAEFITADALDVLTDTAFLHSFDVVTAGPPCQALTTMSNRWRGNGGLADQHINLIPAVRARLQAWGGLYVIENVTGARPHLQAPVLLSGGMFGLGVERPRLFECNWPLYPAPARKVADPIGVYGREPDGRRLFTRRDGTIQRAARGLTEGQAAMGIDWMAWHDLTEAIPPAYTEHVGRQLRDHVTAGAA